MGFDPKKFLAETAPAGEAQASGFDPKRFLSETSPTEAPQPESRPIEALSQGYGQMVTMGHLPQLQSKLEPVTDRIYNLLTGNKVDPASWDQMFSNNKDYVAARDSNIKNIEGLKKSNPGSYYSGSALGVVNLGLMGPGQAGVQGMTAAHKAKLAAQQAASLGAVFGVLNNPGDVEGVVDDLQLGPRLKNAVIGAFTGFGAQVGLNKIAQHSKPLAEKLFKAAEMRAAKALGLERATQKQLGDKAVQKVGRYALDENIVTPLAGTKKMIARNEAAKQKGGQLMDEAYSAVDDAGASEFNPLNAASKVDEKIGDFWRSPINKGETAQLDRTLESIRMRAPKQAPPKTVDMQKIGYYKQFKPETETLNYKVFKPSKIKTSASEAADYGDEYLNAMRELGEKGEKGLSKKSLNILNSEGKFDQEMIQAHNGWLYQVETIPGANQNLTRWMGMGSKQDAINESIAYGIKPEQITGARKISVLDLAKERSGKQLTANDITETVVEKIPSSISKTTVKTNIGVLPGKISQKLIPSKQNPNIPLREAQILKQELGKVANWKNNLNITDKERMARDAYGVVSDAISEATEKGAKAINRLDVVEKLQKGKSLYGNAKSAEKLLTNRQAREQGNKLFGLTDWIAGGAAVAVNPWLLSAVGAKKLLERYGNQTTARFLNNAANKLSKIPNLAKLPDKSPTAFQALVYRLAVKTDEGLGSLADVKEIKGRDRWIASGLEKISDDKSIDLENPKVVKKLLFDKKGEDFLIDISGASKDSKRMASTKEKIKDYLKEVK